MRASHATYMRGSSTLRDIVLSKYLDQDAGIDFLHQGISLS